MNKKNVPLIALIISLIVLASIVEIGCLVGKSESDSLMATAHDAVNARIKWLDDQKFEGPDPATPLNVNLNSVESNTHRIGRDGEKADVDIGIGGGGGGGG